MIRTESSYWHEVWPRVYQAFPYHHLIQPSAHELHQLLVRHNVLALRFSAPVEAPTGIISYHIIQDIPYQLTSLKRQTRHNIQQGLNQCKVEQISFERLAGEGWVLQKDTLERQVRAGSMKEHTWRRICLAAEGVAGFEAWASLVDGHLAAALLTTRIDDTCYVPYSLSHRQYLGKYVNNALFYTVTCDMLSRAGVQGVFFTVQSLDAPSSVDEFKLRMGFQAREVRQRVVFHPALKLLANHSTYRLLVRLLKQTPNDYFLAKTEGMLRFYLQGQLPLDQQSWPECLVPSEPKSSDRPNS